MNTEEFIKKLPDSLKERITYLIYSPSYTNYTKWKLDEVKGAGYSDNVDIVCLTEGRLSPLQNVYIDPSVYAYTGSWNN